MQHNMRWRLEFMKRKRTEPIENEIKIPSFARAEGRDRMRVRVCVCV